MSHQTVVEDPPHAAHRLTVKQQEMVVENMGLAGIVTARFPGRRDYHDYQERLSEAYLGLCQAALDYDETRSLFSTYGYIGARLALIRQARRPLYRGRNILDRAVSLSAGRSDSIGECDPDPDAEGELTEQSRRLHAAIDALPERTREIIRGRMRGETLRGLAGRLGISYERVRQVIGQAHGKIRESLERGRP